MERNTEIGLHKTVPHISNRRRAMLKAASASVSLGQNYVVRGDDEGSV
jgi:hypothetical protein